MAPIPPSSDTSSIPLADHFFIAGIESSQVYDDRIPAPPSASPPVDTTIDEDEALETNPRTPRPVTPSSPEGGKRRSRYSFEARKSIGSIISASELKGTASNRSSTTIKGVQIGGGLSDEDFEQALRKFATERESFLEEIQTSAGTVIPTPNKSRHRTKTVRITNSDDAATGNSGSGLRGGVGSLRRRLSTMNSLKRQPSAARQCKTCCCLPLRARTVVLAEPEH